MLNEPEISLQLGDPYSMRIKIIINPGVGKGGETDYCKNCAWILFMLYVWAVIHAIRVGSSLPHNKNLTPAFICTQKYTYSTN